MVGKLEQLNKKLQKDLIKLESSKCNQEEKLSRVPSRSKNPLQHNSLNKIVKKFSTANLDTANQVETVLSSLKSLLASTYFYGTGIVNFVPIFVTVTSFADPAVLVQIDPV